MRCDFPLGKSRLFLFPFFKLQGVSMLSVIQPTIQSRIWNLLLDKRGDDYGEKAVILVLVVLGGVAAFAAFGGKIVDLIGQATSGI
jgi:hypothetical protein